MLFIVFLIFVFSEGMLFISFFWASFHSSCSPIIEEILYVPDPCELTYTNTLILSNAALSLGCAFICRESNQNISIISFILAWTFILLQLKEFRNMAFYINDSIFGSIFFFLTGLHFFPSRNSMSITINCTNLRDSFWNCVPDFQNESHIIEGLYSKNISNNSSLM